MAITDIAITMSRQDLPAVHRIADTNSLRAQRAFFRATRIRLAMLVGAGAAGGFTWARSDSAPDIAGVVAAVAFMVALTVETYLLQAKPERQWYDSRAAAETSKTLAWRYAVGGDPFVIDDAREIDADALFIRRLREIPVDLEDADLTPSIDEDVQISPLMRSIRSRSLDDRKVAYERGRIADQLHWYARSSKRHASRARMYASAMLFVEVAGVIGGLLRAMRIVDALDPFQVTSALAAAVGAWAQARQHETLARAYAVAALELSSIRALIDQQTTEPDWARFVEDSEEAISREHTLWRASRGARRPALT